MYIFKKGVHGPLSVNLGVLDMKGLRTTVVVEYCRLQNTPLESSHYEFIFNFPGNILTGFTSMNALSDSCTVVWMVFLPSLKIGGGSRKGSSVRAKSPLAVAPAGGQLWFNAIDMPCSDR